MEVKRSLRLNNVALAVVLFLVLFVLPATIALVQLGSTPFSSADPSLTPQNIVESLNWDTAITISYETPTQTAVSYIKYGLTEDNLDLIANDLRGPAISSEMHYIQIEGLQTNSTYYYKIVINNDNEYDNNGVPFQFATLNLPPSPTPIIENDVSLGFVTPETSDCIVYAHAIGNTSTSRTVTTYTTLNGTFTILRSMFLDKTTNETVSFDEYDQMLVFAKCNSTTYGGKVLNITEDTDELALTSDISVNFYNNNLTDLGSGNLTPTSTPITQINTPTPDYTLENTIVPTPTAEEIPPTDTPTITPTVVLPRTDIEGSNNIYIGILFLVLGYWINMIITYQKNAKK